MIIDLLIPKNAKVNSMCLNLLISILNSKWQLSIALLLFSAKLIDIQNKDKNQRAVKDPETDETNGITVFLDN